MEEDCIVLCKRNDGTRRIARHYGVGFTCTLIFSIINLVF